MDYLRARGRAPTRGAHTVGLFARTGEGTHEGCPYGWIICAHGGGHPRGGHIRLDYLRARGRAPTRGAHTVGLFARTGEGTHEGGTYGWIICAHGGEGTHEGGTYGWIICAHGGGHPRGGHIRLDYLRARGRAPTRGAHTVGLFARTGEGTHEGGTYGWIICAHGGGHPRGGHIRLDYLRARGRAPTRGAHTVGLFARTGEGTHEGGTYGWIICAHGGGHPRGGHIRLDYLRARGRAPTRGAHTVGLFARTGEGTHEGGTYGWIICAHGGAGHPRGGHIRLDYLRARGRAPTRGAHTVGLFARTGEGTHEGGTYGWIICAHGGGHPRGGHIRLDYLRARGRAPTRGAHTVGLFARTGEGTHEGCPYGWVTRRRR